MSVKAVNRKSGYSFDFTGDIYGTIIDVLPDAILLIDKNGNLIDVNKRACKMTGYSREELLNMEFGSLLPEEPREEVLCTFEGHEGHERHENDKLLLKEFDLVKKDGSIIHAELKCSIFCNYFFCIIRDITKRKKAEEKLQEFSYAFDSSIDGIVITDCDWNIVHVNEAYAKMFGYKKDELIGKHLSIFYTPEYQEFLIETIETTMKKGGWRGETEEIKKDGTVIPVRISTSLLRDKEVRYIRMVKITRDITESKMAEESLRRSNKLKDLFVDIITHDLMNPVGIALNYAELIEDEDLSDDVRDAVKAIIKSTESIIRIVSNAASLAKLERTEKLELENQDMTVLMNRVIEECRRLAEEKEIEIVTDFDKISFWASYSIRDVFLNVISNAIKYSPNNTKIHITTENLKDRIKIAVKDRGIGVPDEYKESIFERYKRKEKGGVKGSGLGLTIAKLIVELHKGRIWVEDNPGGGSIFYIEIPK